jgi:transcriptional regulator with XRE-family HTH domain
MEKSTFTRDYQVLTELLRAVREDAGITQVELAKRLKQTQSYVSKVERGERRLDVVQLRWFCQALGMSLRSFIDRYERTVGK